MSYHQTISILLIFGLLTSCYNPVHQETTKEPDYIQSYYWASKPKTIEKAIDVFYVYPTLFGGTISMNMDVNNKDMRQLVQHVIPKQAGVFMDDCNVFTPYYRQMSMDGLTMDEEIMTKHLAIGYHDLLKAFDYYINNLNQGRPFILAGHSQGSMLLIQLMKDRFMQAELMDKMVAAYLIGYSITDDDLAEYPWFKISAKADDIGSIITYNTQSITASGSPVLLANAHTENPLNWKNTADYATKELNLGAVFFNEEGLVDTSIMHFTDAYIDQKGALIASLVDSSIYSSSSTFPQGVYHVYDYSIFFNNLKENVGIRIEAYLNK